MHSGFKISMIILSFFFIQSIKAQNIEYGRKIIEKLCSRNMHGRGYYGSGQKKASELIVKELIKWDSKAYNNQYEQYFTFNVNTFPRKIKLKINNVKLEPGIDFVLDAGSPSIKGVFDIIKVDSLFLNNLDSIIRLKLDLSLKILIIDPKLVDKKKWSEVSDQLYNQNSFKAKAFIQLIEREPMFTVSTTISPTPIIYLKRGKLPLKPISIRLQVENQYISPFTTENIIAYQKGLSDSILVLSAHYDHLGVMGRKTYFPGANDNASGVALVLSLAKYYSKQKIKPPYTIVYVFFAGEEAGLLGSTYLYTHPIFPLSKIKMMLNLDMLGSGDKGLTIVNGLKNKEGKLLVSINDDKKYVDQVKLEANRPNSDHYPFAIHNINAFFMFARGQYSFYHHPKDEYKSLPLSKFNEIHHLIVNLIEKE